MNNDTNDQLLLKTSINIWSLVNTFLSAIISLFVIIYILKKNSKNSFHVSLFLTCNTSLTVICLSIILGLMPLASIGGDHNIISHNQIIFWFCHFRGFLVYVFTISLYFSYVLQAGYRFLRIVYYKHKYLRRKSTFSYYIFIQWILSFIIALPILFTNNNYSSLIIYVPDSYNCLVPFNKIRGVICIIITIYVWPLCSLCLIYSKIIIYLRRKGKQPETTLKLRRKNTRDTSVIKRIYTVIIVLFILGFPIIIFFIKYLITGDFHWTVYRICWLTISISLVFISLSSLYLTPPIYKKLRIILGCSKSSKKHSRISYSINIQSERKRKIESIPLENRTFTHLNIE